MQQSVACEEETRESCAGPPFPARFPAAFPAPSRHAPALAARGDGAAVDPRSGGAPARGAGDLQARKSSGSQFRSVGVSRAVGAATVVLLLPGASGVGAPPAVWRPCHHAALIAREARARRGAPANN